MLGCRKDNKVGCSIQSLDHSFGPLSRLAVSTLTAPSLASTGPISQQGVCALRRSQSPDRLFTSIPGFATSTTPHSTASDPAEVQANQCLEQGTQKLEEGDIEAAKALYKRSVDIKKTASSLFNLGVTHYHLSGLLRSSSHLDLICTEEYDDAIYAWKQSITLQPSSPDAHTSPSPLTFCGSC